MSDHGPLLNLKEAASLLGYSEKGFRRIVDRSRAASKGAKVKGPVIMFFQAGRNAPVRFKHEWVESFIHDNTIHPAAGHQIRSAEANIKRTISRPKQRVSKIVKSFDLF